MTHSSAEKIFASGVSSARDPEKAVAEAASACLETLGGPGCDLALVFICEGGEYSDPFSMACALAEKTGAKHWLGCNASGVIADRREIEMEPAVSVLAMRLPDVLVRPFCLSPAQVEQLGTPDDLVGMLDLFPNEDPKFICLADPMTTDISRLLAAFDGAYEGCPVVGGLASGAVVQNRNLLWINGEQLTEGAAVAALSGDIRVTTVVSQGCRPVGEPLAVTKAEKNVLYEIAGKPAMQVLREMYESLSPDDQTLARHSLFVGLAMDEHQHDFSRGDFLIRNIIGGDRDKGALLVGEYLETGQTIQFQLRDRNTSKEDLEAMLSLLNPSEKAAREGGFLVSCCGRGRSLFAEADHNISIVQKYRGPVPVTGFFANGELGPINCRNYIHGYTTSLALFS